MNRDELRHQVLYHDDHRKSKDNGSGSKKRTAGGVKCEARMTTSSMLFLFLRTRRIAGKKTVFLLTQMGILRSALTGFNRSAAALRCQCSFCKVGPWPICSNCSGIPQPGKTLIGTAQSLRLIKSNKSDPATSPEGKQ